MTGQELGVCIIMFVLVIGIIGICLDPDDPFGGPGR